MPEAFLILLAGGAMLAVAVTDTAQVTRRWSQLGGILALSFTAVALYFCLRGQQGREALPGGVWILFAAGVAFVVAQLATNELPSTVPLRVCAAAACICAAAVAKLAFLDGHFPPGDKQGGLRPYGAETLLSLAGAAAACGIVVMEMLLGHAYLTVGGSMTMRPLARLNRVLTIVLIVRALTAGGLAMLLQSRTPTAHLWGVYGLQIAVRWLVGLAIPLALVFMTRDCIKRRATQPATGILYVACVLIFLGEIIGLWLLCETGLPF